MKHLQNSFSCLALMIALAMPAAAMASQATTSTQSSMPEDPVPVVQHTIDRVVKLLESPVDRNDEQAVQQYRDNILDAILDAVDMQAMGRLSLANYYRKFDEKQFERFLELYSHLIFTTYIDSLMEYDNQRVEVIGKFDISDTRVRVESQIVTKGKQEIPIHYNLLKTDNGWRVYDVKVEGVSMVKNYRSQFREILLNGSAEELIERLEQRIARK